MIAIGVFLLVYVIMMALPRWRAVAAILGGVFFVCCGILPLGEVAAAIDWGVLMMIAGSMGLVALFVKSQMPLKMAEVLVAYTHSYKWTIIALACFAGVVSCFVDNVATVVMVSPIAIAVAKKAEVSPVPAVVSIAVASNLEGAATLVGDTTSIMLSSHLGMSFSDFFVYRGSFSLFFIVQLSFISATAVLLFILRKRREVVSIDSATCVTDYLPTVLLLVSLCAMVWLSLLESKPDYMLGLVMLGIFLVGLIADYVKYRDVQSTLDVIKSIDYNTIVLLAGLFVLIGGIEEQGVIDGIAGMIVELASDNLFALYSIIVWGSVAVSAIIDNIPYVATMLPVIAGIEAGLGIDGTVLYFGLLAGATLGGNITPIGSSANVAAFGILEQNGYSIKSRAFVAISLPYTLVAVLVGYIAVWALYCP